MSQMNLDISPGQAVWPRVILRTWPSGKSARPACLNPKRPNPGIWLNHNECTPGIAPGDPAGRPAAMRSRMRPSAA